MDAEFDLSPLLMEVNSPFGMDMSSSMSPAPMPEVVPRPISKRRGKKRSSRACTTCRARKVRCNIVAHGAPCSNCRHDEIDCVLPLSRRQRSARERAEASLRNSTKGSEAGERRSGTVDIGHCLHEHDEAGVSNYQDQQWEREKSEHLGPHGMPLSDHILSEVLPPSSINSSHSFPTPRAPTSSRTKSWIQIQSPLASAPSIKTPEGQIPRLPRVFAPFPRHLAHTDLAYLNSRDALTLPEEKFQLELLKAYVEFVHGSMPILDLEEFLSSVKYGYESQDGQRGRGIERENALKKQIPLLLFQAVMFAGVGFVSMGALRAAGYQSRETAKRVFFSRVRLCYDFDTSTDRQSIIQSLLLMSTTTSTPSHDGKDAWHWLGLAISLCYSLGLHRGPSQPNSSPRKKKLERRIWWAAFIRDRTLALGSSGWARAVRVRRDDCDIEMLSLSDFDVADSEDKDESMEDIRERQNAVQCVEKARLCWCSNDVLLTNFPPQSLPLPPPSTSAPQFEFQQTNILEISQMSEHHNSVSPDRLVFETQEEAEYRLVSESSPSVHDCPTPREVMQIIERKEQSRCVSPLVAGFGVDGEYDDYLEFLRPMVGKEKQRGGRETWAFQLDCENDRVVEV